MDFELTDEQRAFAETVRRFARTELAPGAAARAHSHTYPWDVAKKLSEMAAVVNGVVAVDAASLNLPRTGGRQ